MKTSPDSFPQKRGLCFYFWTVFVSILLGVLAVAFNLGFAVTDDANNFKTLRVLQRILIYSGVSFVVLLLLILFFKLLRRFFRWLFSWRNIRHCLIAFAFLIFIAVIFYVEEDWRGKRAWENYKREWEAKGEHFDFGSFVPPYIPDDKNFALTPIVASCYSRLLDKNGHRVEPQNTNVVNRLEMNIYSNGRAMQPDVTNNWQKGTAINLKVWQEYFRAPMDTNFLKWQPAATNEFPITPEPQSPADDVLLALSKYDSAIEELRLASQMPCSRFPLNYDVQPADYILLPHLTSLRQCAQVLQLRAVAELENGQNQKALDDVKLIFYLAKSICDEPFLISHLVRLTSMNCALQPIWEGLSEHKWSGIQITVIEDELSQFDFPSDYQFFVRAERATAIGTIDYMERSRTFAEFRKGFHWGDDDDGYSMWEQIFQAANFYFIPKGWFYQNDIAIARMFQQSLLVKDEVDRRIISPEVALRASNALTTEFAHRSPYSFYAQMFFPEVGRTAQKVAVAQTSVDMARTACALERYHLVHSEYPEMLDALAPQFIEKIPHDVINGQPLHYRRTDDGNFLLYSVGWNETDDGGVVVLGTTGRLVDLKKGDWVWRYPSK